MAVKYTVSEIVYFRSMITYRFWRSIPIIFSMRKKLLIKRYID